MTDYQIAYFKNLMTGRVHAPPNLIPFRRNNYTRIRADNVKLPLKLITTAYREDFQTDFCAVWDKL